MIPARRHVGACLSDAVNPLRGNKDGGSSLLGHDAVVGFPVVVASSGCREDLAKESRQATLVEPRRLVVWPDEFRVTLDGDPLSSQDDGHRALGPET